MYSELLAPINAFLKCETPDSWIESARLPENLPILLIDHCNCELKAAQTAMFMLRKYALDEQNAALLLKWAKPYEDFVYNKQRDIDAFLSRELNKNDFSVDLKTRNSKVPDSMTSKLIRLIKEEFHHFEQVLEIMQQRNIPYQNLRAARYAKGLMKLVRTYEPEACIDKLIIGAFIEARSCERFAKLAPFLDDDLKKFYTSLLRSEARHYQDYLILAREISDVDIDERVAFFAAEEAKLIQSPDDEFKFHSGAPMAAVS